MRMSRSTASATVAVALLLSLPYEAVPHARVKTPVPAPELFGAACRTAVSGSHVTAYCHNPYPETDRVSLHVQCDRWWDVGSDGSPVAAGPAMTVRLTGRCWKDVGAVWVSHQKG
ncbi:hypothetical protein ABZ439_19680 [Streptomyces sp. NPDC005840]|uniref:hypothetical protein n=1 Tax=Streptomyces sp. NPDC005840 TaxID=3157072 RepID=UPI0033D8BBAF